MVISVSLRKLEMKRNGHVKNAVHQTYFIPVLGRDKYPPEGTVSLLLYGHIRVVMSVVGIYIMDRYL